MSPTGSALALLFAAAAGAASGFVGRRLHERESVPPTRARPAPLSRALRAWEGGDTQRAHRELEALAQRPPAGAEDAAEARLLRALVADDSSALRALVEAAPDTRAAARALWALVERAPDPERRAAARAEFERRYPDAWVLRVSSRGGG